MPPGRRDWPAVSYQPPQGGGAGNPALMFPARDIEAVRLLTIIEAGRLAARASWGLPWSGFGIIMSQAYRTAQATGLRRARIGRGECRDCGHPQAAPRCESCRVASNVTRNRRRAERLAVGLPRD